MYSKLARDKFSGILDRFWTRFCRNWDVLLHGNPAVDVFGGLKLAAGGELGYGVGEEDWGSGDREVLEHLVHRTEGLVDMVVSRFGDAHDECEPSQDTIHHTLPWLGCGHEPQAADGLVFGGVGAISRSSIRDIATWTRDIYAYGEHAYGVKDNPHRQRRKRRRRQPVEDVDAEPEITPANDENVRKKAIDQLKHAKQVPPGQRPQMHDRVATYERAGIPPPIVGAAEASLAKASASVDAHSSNQPAHSSTWGLGSSDKWVRYLTFGLASGTTRSESPKRPDNPRRTSSSSSKTTIKGVPSSSKPAQTIKEEETITTEPPMQHLDPNPDGYDVMAQLQLQKRLENVGHFLIGHRGDLEREPAEGDDSDTTIGGSEVPEEERNLLRTIKVELTGQPNQNDDLDSRDSFINSDTSSRLRVLVYVHRPFIHVLLFEQHTPALSMTAFYRELHQTLRPLHKGLLNSTSPEKVAERIAASHSSPTEPSSINTKNPPFAPPRNNPVYDLVYDPVNLTCHTSLPNIPEPGGGLQQHSTSWSRLEALNVHSHILFTLSHSARNPRETERTSKTSRHWWVVWLRVPQPETHTDNQSHHHHPKDGALAYPRPEHCRTAFLVRRARDHVVGAQGKYASSVGNGGGGGGGIISAGTRGMASRVSSGMYNLVGVRAGGQSGNGGNISAEENAGGWGSAAALAGGIGIDARKYVENLLSLNR
jgi:hypothetical protein